MVKAVALVLVSVAVITAAWLMSRIPGEVEASIDGTTIQTSAPVALLGVALVLGLIITLLKVVRAVIAVPRAARQWRRGRRVVLGHRSITRLLVALAAGELDAARKEAGRARRFLGDSPQVLSLLAEAERLAGRDDEANKAFQALTISKDAKFLGFRGLLRQSLDRQDWASARMFARQAEAVRPGTVWLRQQRIELELKSENWVEALSLMGNDPRRSICCVAAADAETDAAHSLRLAKQAWRRKPDFAPAVLAYASRLRAAGNERRAQSCITQAWRLAPHPELAAFELAPQPDKLGRAKIAKTLAAAHPEHVESHMLLARTALDAGLMGEARHQVEIALLKDGPRRRSCLLLAELEEKERGDTEIGRAALRNALRDAANAEPDPHWQCIECRTEHGTWRPKCPTCTKIGTIQWIAGKQVEIIPNSRTAS